MQLKSSQIDHKHEQEILAQHLKEKERVFRKLKHIESQLKGIQETIPLVNMEKEKVHHQVIQNHLLFLPVYIMHEFCL